MTGTPDADAVVVAEGCSSLLAGRDSVCRQ